MRKKNLIGLAAVLLILAAILAWGFSHTQEPMYQGQPLSFWLQGYVATERTETTQPMADTAMREIGTNAIPTLLRMLEAHDSTMKLKLLDLLRKQSFFKIDTIPAERLNLEAVGGFNQLGAQAKNAVPELITIYERNISPDSQDAAVISMGAIGPSAKSAVPVLIKALGNTNSEEQIRIHALLSLVEIHSETTLVVPELIKALKNPKTSVRSIAPFALGEFGAEARPAVPALIEALKDPDQGVRNEALHALQKIDPEAAAKYAPKAVEGLER